MQLSLHNGSASKITVISNVFIDHYLPASNGEYVKIYLYLLRCLQGGQQNLDLTFAADVFDCTETDILRALRYWESKKLVVLSGTNSQTSIDFLEPMLPERPKESTAKDTSLSLSKESSGASKKAPSRPKAAPKAASAAANHLSADRLKELREKEEVRQILFVAEQYMGKTLSRTAVDDLLYIYEELHFSADLMDYLIEYCVSKGSSDMHYIKKVAFSWHEEGIDTVTAAKQSTTTYHRNYFTILKAFGITNRNPVAAEVQMIDHWIKDYGFSMEILTEACTRTVAATGKSNFRYADKILSGWKERGVRHLSDIQALDTLHRQLQTERGEQKPRRNNTAAANGNRGNRFNNFQQRNYNYQELESQLLKQ